MTKRTWGLIAFLALCVLAFIAIPAYSQYQTKVYFDSNGDRMNVASGGELQVESGGIVDIQAGATVSFAAGVSSNMAVSAPTAVGTATPALYVNNAGVSDQVAIADGGVVAFQMYNGGGARFTAPTAIATAVPGVVINQNGVSNPFEIRAANTPVFSVNAAGDLTYSGTPVVNGASYVNAPTAIATATPALFVNSAGVSNLFEVRDAATPVFQVHDSGDIDVIGGMPGANTSGDVLDITSTGPAINGSDVIQVIDINLTGGAATGEGNELIGIDLALTTADVQARERAILANDADWEMAMDAGANPIVSTAQTWFDDYMGDTIQAENILANGSDDVAVDPALAQDQYGVVTLVAGDTGTNCAADCSEIALGLHYMANQGGLMAEFRVHFDTSVAAAAACLGLSDTNSLEMPASIGGSDAVTDVATDYAAFCYDTGADTDEWFALSADGGAGGTGRGATGTAPVADTYQTLRIEVDASGAQCRFYIDGTLVKTITAGCISPDVAIGPVVVMQSLTTAAKTMDLDYTYVTAKR